MNTNGVEIHVLELGFTSLDDPHFPLKVENIPADLEKKVLSNGVKWNSAIKVAKNAYFVHGTYDVSLVPERFAMNERDGCCASFFVIKVDGRWKGSTATNDYQEAFLEALGGLAHAYAELNQFYT